MPFLKSGVTLAVFQSFGYIPVRIDFENIEVREGATTVDGAEIESLAFDSQYLNHSTVLTVAG